VLTMPQSIRRNPVNDILRKLVPHFSVCMNAEWHDEDNSGPPCENCEDCNNSNMFMHMYRCLEKDIPPSSEALRLEKVCNQHTIIEPGASASAIAAAKQQHGLDNHNNSPCMYTIKAVWHSLLLSNPEFVSVVSEFLIASWNHVSVNMYERGTETDESDTETDESGTETDESDTETDKSVTETELLKRRTQAYQEMCRFVKNIDDNVGVAIQIVSHNHILPNAYREYKKFLKNCGHVFVCEVDNDKIDARKKEIGALSDTIAKEKDELQNLQVVYDTMEPEYKKLIDMCKVH